MRGTGLSLVPEMWLDKGAGEHSGMEPRPKSGEWACGKWVLGWG